MSGDVRRPARPRPEVAERRAKVLRMRAAGMTWTAIATATGQRTAQQAQADYQRAIADGLRAVTAGVTAEDVALELERMDECTRRANAVMLRADSRGDDELTLHAIDRVVKVSKRRGELQGAAAAAGAGSEDDPEPGWLDQLAERRQRRRARYQDPPAAGQPAGS